MAIQSRILIVEDENIVALDIKMNLVGLDYEVIGTVDNGEEAVYLAIAETPDLILMDINLRGKIDGIETARQIQEQKNIPIIFLTAYADESTFRRAITTEPFGYVLKPFEEKELRTAIEVALYRHQMEAQLRAVAAENERLRKEVQMYAEELEDRVTFRTTQLVQAHDRLKLILNNVNEAICFLDEDNIILYMNPAAEKITGYTTRHAFGNDSSLWRGTTSEAVLNQLEQALSNGQIWQGDVVNRRQDGVLYDAELRIIPLQNEEGKVYGFVSTLRDVSDAKELQRLKANFVSRIGHELRTPLANMHLYLELLQRKSEEKYEKYVSILQGESKRLEKLIIGFMGIASLDTAVDPPELEPLEVNPLLIDVVGQYEDEILLKELTIKYQFTPELLAKANMHLLEQALSHLIDNAILYASHKSQITIETAVQARQDKEWVAIAITELGTVISPHEQSQLFDRFFRGEAAINAVIPGAGLGLAFCRESLEQQDGFITVASDPKIGNCFTIWLQKVTESSLPS